MKLNKLIDERYSTRAFSERPIEEEKISLLFSAAGIAPSSYNTQPWRFIYAEKTNEKLYGIFLESMSDFNRSWAKNAPLIVLSLAKRTYSHNGKEHKFCVYDLGLAISNLTIQASEMGLFLHQMGGFSADFVRDKLAISDDYEIVTLTAIGYLGDKNNLPEDLRKIENKPRERKTTEEIVSNKGFIW